MRPVLKFGMAPYEEQFKRHKHITRWNSSKGPATKLLRWSVVGHSRGMKNKVMAMRINALIFIVLVPGNMYDWMRVNLDPDVARPPISESKLKHHFSNLNKYGNDSSGCPVSPDQFIKVSYQGAGGGKYNKRAIAL